MAAKGKWAQGITPRNFHWIMKDRLAVSERPGGYGSNHRKVRRQEEIIWVREQGFTCVLSIIPAPHNLHNYDELGVVWRHRGFENTDEPEAYLAQLYPELRDMLAEGQKILLHADNVNDAVCGLLTGYLVWAGLIQRGPEAVTLMERMVQRQLGPFGRDLVHIAAGLPNAAPGAKDAFTDKPPVPREPEQPAAMAKSTKKAAKKTAKASAKKTGAKKASASKTPVKKAPAKKAAAKKVPAKKAPAAKKAATRAKSKA